MKKKFLTAIALTVAAITLVVCTVFVTVAYLTASSSVSNVFTVGDVSIAMFESKVDSDGEAIVPQERVDTNSYHLTPGKTYSKDPTIKITSLLEQDEMYLFVKSSNQIRKAESGNNGGSELTMRKQMEKNGWVEYVMSGDGVEIVWVYGTRDINTGIITPTVVDPTYIQTRGDSTQGPEGEIRLCENFTIDSNADVKLYGAASVNFTGFAIQTSDMDDVYKAWDGIKQSYPYDCGIVNPVNPYSGSTEKPYDPAPGVAAALPTPGL